MYKKYYKSNKNTFDICFVGAKYIPRAVNKGYDVFIDVAKKLATMSKDIRFHVVGNLDETDIDVTEIKDRITFYGFRNKEFFPSFYSNMDMILSPNRPDAIIVGAFDGFPTGCCTQAAMCGVAVFCTDIIGLNIYFTNNKDIAIISRNIDEIVQRVYWYFNNTKELYTLSENGRSKFLEVFNIDNQMKKRIEILQKAMD